MLVICFALALTALTVFFDDWIANQNNPNTDPASVKLADGSLQVVLLRNRQGHYVSAGTINGKPVTFLLDTGATDVAVPVGIAKKLDLKHGARAQGARRLQPRHLRGREGAPLLPPHPQGDRDHPSPAPPRGSPLRTPLRRARLRRAACLPANPCHF